MKKLIERILHNFIINTEIFKDVKEEKDNYDCECGKKQRTIEKLQHDLKLKEQEKQECILSGQTVIEEKTNQIKSLKKDISLLESKLNTKEKQRRKAAGSVGGCKIKIKKLEEEIKNLNERIEFLKTNRRAPSIEELKDYKYKRKKSVSK